MAGLGATFAHNHPNGTGPSKEDVEVAIEYGFHELRVVTRDRRFIVHSFSSVQTVAFAAEYQANWPKVERTVVDEIRRGQLNPYDFRGELVHRTLDRTSKALRFRYEREMS